MSDRNISDLAFIVEQAIKKINDGESKFHLSNFNMRSLCLSDFPEIPMDAMLSSDYGVDTGYKDIEKIYYEEVGVIEELLKENNVKINLADWQKGGTHIDKIFKDGNRRAYAMQIWDTYANPFRFVSNRIFLINSPRDLFGTPIIREYDPKEFLTTLPYVFEKQVQREIDMEKKLKKSQIWETVGILSVIITVLYIISKIL